MGDIANAVELAIRIAEDDSHGYAQDRRNGDPDYDCSSFLSTVLYRSGFPISPNSWTGNMLEQLRKCGFKDCKAPWKAGDIHITPGKHVVMSVSPGDIVHASINELGKATGGKPGDQTGKEICVRSYYDKPWSYHLRYEGESTILSNSQLENVAREVINGKWGVFPTRKERLEAKGYNYEVVQSKVNELLKKKDSDLNHIELGKIAREVIRGKWGKGSDRRKRLTAAGYDYIAVQSLVNTMLGRK